MKEEEYLSKYLEPSLLKDGLKQLKNGIPVQYIIGNVDFCGYKINVDKRVLIPRFETEELVDNTIKLLKKNFDSNINILDIGTGSGCIAIALKKNIENSNVYATDISKDALDVAKMNMKENNVDINLINTNLYDGINLKFDCVISNPPYISKNEKIMDIVYNNEPHCALFADNNGLYYYEEILKNINKILKDKYLICFEIGESQFNDIDKFRQKYLKDSKILLKKDMQNRNRMVFIYNFE